jgi:hypothetical protein
MHDTLASRHKSVGRSAAQTGEMQSTQRGPSNGSAQAMQRISSELNASPHVTALNAMSRQINSPDRTGLGAGLKAGLEALSGLSMDHVRVRRNSPKPAQLQARAYAQGGDIHLGPGHERHLPHEAWHVVQQAQGRVKPTVQMMANLPINDDLSLENEAELMGAKAKELGGNIQAQEPQDLKPVQRKNNEGDAPIQCIWIKDGDESFVWHTTRDGVVWHFDQENELMYFTIQKHPKNLSQDATSFYEHYEGQRHSYEGWVGLMSEGFDNIEDKDDPVHENPEFLVDEDSHKKIEIMEMISSALRARGVGVFLGGAASGALITRTRQIKDLDLRIDKIDGEPAPRDVFNNAKYDNDVKYHNFFSEKIVSPLEERGLKVSDIQDAGYTTRRFLLNDSIDVSVTSEPAGDLTMSRGEMVTGITSLGEFDFLLDKAAAMVERKDNSKQLTDLADIIQVGRSMNGRGFFILSALMKMRTVKASKIKNYNDTVLKQLANLDNGKFNGQRKVLAEYLGVEVKDIPELVLSVRNALMKQNDDIKVL